MSGCDRSIDVEDMVLGLMPGADVADLEAHVESCADCMQAREMFLAERALFAARPAPAPPPLALPKPAIARVYRFVPALAAVAACVAIMVGRPHAEDCDEPAPAVAISARTTPEEAITAGASAICRAPESVAAPAVSLASHDTNACVPSPSATCDVTSSTATP